MAKETYKCILYDIGDKVKSRFENLFQEENVFEIESTELKYVGIFPCLFLKFIGKPADITDLSQYYIPAGETKEKYKDGLKYFTESKVAKQQQEKASSHGAKVHSTFRRAIKNEPIDLNDTEVFKTRVVPRGTFSGKPPVKKESDNN